MLRLGVRGFVFFAAATRCARASISLSELLFTRCCSPDEDERLNADFLAAATYLSCGDDLVVSDDLLSHVLSQMIEMILSHEEEGRRTCTLLLLLLNTSAF